MGRDARWARLGLGGVALAVGVLLTLWWARDPGGPRLARKDVAAAREHLHWRELLEAMSKEPIEAADAGPEDVEAAEVRRALLASRLRSSRFAHLAVADLRAALVAADEGRFLPEPAEEVARGIYGEDDRKDCGEVEEERDRERDRGLRAQLTAALAQARGVGAWVHRASVQPVGDGARLDASTLGSFWNLCSDERFADQPMAALGTAFLVEPDLVATAGHVIEDVPLYTLRLVFDYEVREGQDPQVVREVYEPIRVLAVDAGEGTWDWALVRLDRPVTGRPVLQLARDTERAALRPDAAVYMWGHSAGTPKKLTRGRVRSNAARSNSLRVDLDAFGGDSGSPVFNAGHQVVGILFGGSEDFERVPSRGGCRVVASASGRGGGEYVTRVECFEGKVRR